MSRMSARRAPARRAERCYRREHKSAAVVVVLERGCFRKGVSTLTVLVLRTDDQGRQAQAETVRFLRRLFGGDMPTLAPMAITRDPRGHPAYLFLILQHAPRPKFEEEP